MTQRIFVITSSIYDERDFNLWSHSKAFSDKEKARAFYERETAEMLADAKGEEDEQYPVDFSERGEDVCAFSRDAGEAIYYRVEISEQKIEL